MSHVTFLSVTFLSTSAPNPFPNPPTPHHASRHSIELLLTNSRREWQQNIYLPAGQPPAGEEEENDVNTPAGKRGNILEFERNTRGIQGPRGELWKFLQLLIVCTIVLSGAARLALISLPEFN
jgi:hypothetical protein